MKSIFFSPGVFYEFVNPKEIRDFLSEYSFVSDFLIEIYKNIKKIFADNLVSVKLECLTESDEKNFTELFVKIKTNLSFEESLDLLDEFDKFYWLGTENRIRNIVEVTVY